MLDNKKVVVVLPAYNAEKTLQKTYDELPLDCIDAIILVDDCSSDRTTEIAAEIGIDHVIRQPENLGYGANQKACYRKALEIGADVVIMVHPDYQYDPRLVRAMGAMISSDVFDCCLGSRILSGGALAGGMPLYKFVANRALTLYQNLLLPAHISEYHTGLRAFSRKVLESIPYAVNSDDFIFDNEMLLQIIGQKFRIGEITCPTRYQADSSSINFIRSSRYGLGILAATLEFRLARWGLIRSRRFDFRD